VQHLPLEIGEIHHVTVDDPDRTDTRGGEVECRRGSESTCTHEQHARLLELALATDANFGERQVAGIAKEFVRRKL